MQHSKWQNSDFSSKLNYFLQISPLLIISNAAFRVTRTAPSCKYYNMKDMEKIELAPTNLLTLCHSIYEVFPSFFKKLTDFHRVCFNFLGFWKTRLTSSNATQNFYIIESCKRHQSMTSFLKVRQQAVGSFDVYWVWF